MQFLSTMIAAMLLALLQEDLACIGGGVYSTSQGGALGAVVLGCMLGTAIGDLAWIYLGRRLGPGAIRRAPLRWFVSEPAVAKGRTWLTERTTGVIFLSRFLPGFRTPLHLALGFSHLPMRRMAPQVALVAVAYVSLLSTLAAGLAALASRVALASSVPVPLLLFAAGVALWLGLRLAQRYLGGWAGRLFSRGAARADSASG